MAKRFTDTELWKKSWFRTAKPKIKCLFRFLVDNCDHAGILDIDYGLMSFMIGDEITESDLNDLSEQFETISKDKIFIPSFIHFQYKVSDYAELNPENNAHKGVISQLKKYNLLAPKQPLNSPCSGAQDKEKDKDKVKDLDMDKVKDNLQIENFENWWSAYGRIGNKKTALKLWQKLSEDQREKCLSVVVDYVRSTPDVKFRKHGSTYLNQEAWEDAIIPYRSPNQKAGTISTAEYLKMHEELFGQKEITE
jgi:hypothetical protein